MSLYHKGKNFSLHVHEYKAKPIVWSKWQFLYQGFIPNMKEQLPIQILFRNDPSACKDNAFDPSNGMNIPLLGSNVYII